MNSSEGRLITLDLTMFIAFLEVFFPSPFCSTINIKYLQFFFLHCDVWAKLQTTVTSSFVLIQSSANQ